MKTVIDQIQAERVLQADQVVRLGLSPHAWLRITLETIEPQFDALPPTGMNGLGGAFCHLDQEPDIYADSDLVERNAHFAG